MTEQPPLGSALGDDALAALLEKHALGPLHSSRLLTPTDREQRIVVNDALLLRLTTDAAAIPRLRREALIVRRLRRASDVPCPEVLAADTQRDVVPADVLITSYVDGRRADTVWHELDLLTREQLSEDLGRICGTLHHLPWPAYGDVDPGAPPIAVSARWTDIINARIARLYAASERLSLLPQPVLDDLVTVLNDGDALFDTPSAPTLTHNDLGLWHIVLRQEGAAWQIAALLGWGSALVADAAWEFANLAREPVEAYPMSDAFTYGYRERHPLQDDLSVRRRLYRLLTFWERALDSAERRGNTAPLTLFFRTGILRLLKPR